MKVSTRVHYGLRAMTELARSYREERLLSISEIARNEALPLSYLEQLVGELRRAGLVEGTRGVHGGYRLARAPEAITVGDIYRILEGEVAPVDCTAEDYLPSTWPRSSCRSMRWAPSLQLKVNSRTYDLLQWHSQGRFGCPVRN